mmetsp:Transcript_22147/g.52428  ORF Transcript_22147/g.52428 Transcript_22147/m.52428 type:complete len:375 (+) Transcript_22147:96-1220(+)
MSKDDDVTIPSSEGEEDTDASLADMKKVMETQITCEKTGKKKSYWSVALETMGMAGGKDGEGDLWLEDVDQGIPMLKKYIKDKDLQLAEEKEQAKKNKFPFNSYMDLVPLDEFHTTQTNFLKAFLKWASKDREDVVEGSEDAKLVVNASKARRRLDSYFDWMKDNMASDFAENPLTLDSVKDAAKAWGLEASHTKDNQLAWWFDLEKMDYEALKTVPAKEQLRYVVWYSHLVIFDHKAQDNGVLLMEDLNKIGFWGAMTLIPLELSAKMDRFTIGVVPVKMKGIYAFGCARWMHLMMGLMKPFLSKKMRDRMFIITDSTAPDKQKYLDDLVGRDSIPERFMGLDGGSPPDVLIKRLAKKGKKKAEKKSKEEGEK